MKILQVHRGRAFDVLDVPIPEPGPLEVLVKVDAVTTCPQWDLHLRRDEPMFPGHRFEYPYTPGQPGHEAAGEVVEVGVGVDGLAPGDRVATWRDPGHHVPGCYAQYVVQQAANLVRVPAHMPPESVAPVELATSVAASILMLRGMGALEGKRVGVMGLGSAGLIAAQMARAEGAASVVGFDVYAGRREMALRVGLDAAPDPQSDLSHEVPPRWVSPAIDTAIECVGAKETVEWMMDRTGDALALFGVQREDYLFRPRHYYPALRLCGYPGPTRAAAEHAVGMLTAGKIDLTCLVSCQMPLERYAEAVDLLESQEAVKVCFRPWM